ncbi:MAG TPA: TIM barrel protein [Vicinamibacteria bacterium]
MFEMNRRQALMAGAAFAGGLGAPERAGAQTAAVKLGRIKQSVCRWCYEKIPLPDFCKAVKGLGLTAIDLIEEKEWPLLADHGLVCSMGWKTGGGGIPDGLNDPKNHDLIVKGLLDVMPRAKQLGVPNLIAFFGNRKGMSDDDAIKNCVIGLLRVKQAAEEHGLNVCVELLNSKVDHKDYQGDRTWFGVEVVKRVESPRVKLLYDIYHMQIMEGDIMRTIKNNHQWIAHYHTGGVPGRHELDDSQELNWRTVSKTIAETGFTGYVAHEFVPTRDPLTSLREAIVLCDV